MNLIGEPMPDGWMEEGVAAVLAAGGKIGHNEHGTPVSLHTCKVCGEDYTICPPSANAVAESVCHSPDCDSYDPARDAEVFFMPDDPDLIEP